MRSVRNKLPSYSHKEKTNILLATSQQKLQAISPRRSKLSAVAEWCKEHPDLCLLRFSTTVRGKWGFVRFLHAWVQYRAGGVRTLRGALGWQVI